MKNSLRVLRYNLAYLVRQQGWQLLASYAVAATVSGFLNNTPILFFMAASQAARIYEQQCLRGNGKLYGALPLTHAQFLLGQYLYVGVVHAFSALVCLAHIGAYGGSMLDSVYLALVFFATFTFIQAAYLPGYYRTGVANYNGAGTAYGLVALAIFLVAIIGALLWEPFALHPAASSPVVICLLLFIGGVACLAVSYRYAARNHPRGYVEPAPK